MKIIIRIFGIILSFLLMCILLMRLVNTNIVSNDLQNITTLAMNQTQEIMLNQTIAELVEEEIDYIIFDDESYQNYFKDSFYRFIQEDKRKYYTIKECKSDYDKGILTVTVASNSFPLTKQFKETNIIDYPNSGICKLQKSDKDEEIDYKIPQGKRWNDLLKNKTWPKTLFTWTFETEVEMSSFDIGINYCVSTALDDEYLYWYPGLCLIGTLKDGSEIILAKKSENDCDGPRRLIGSCDEKVMEVRLEITSYQPNNGQEKRINRLTTINNDSSHPYSYIRVKQCGEDEKECDSTLVTSRYIDENLKNISSDSIWNREEYKKVLKEFVE